MRTILLALLVSTLVLTNAEDDERVDMVTKLKYVQACLKGLVTDAFNQKVQVLCQALIIRFLQEVREEKEEQDSVSQTEVVIFREIYKFIGFSDESNPRGNRTLTERTLLLFAKIQKLAKNQILKVR